MSIAMMVKKLKIENDKIENENHVVGHLKAKNHHLHVINMRLLSCLSPSLTQVSKMFHTLAWINLNFKHLYIMQHEKFMI